MVTDIERDYLWSTYATDHVAFEDFVAVLVIALGRADEVVLSPSAVP
jgi:hypothetical protein